MFRTHVARTLRLVAVCLGFVAPSASYGSEEFQFFHENVLGTSMELRLQADSIEAASQAEERVFHEIDRLALILSGYDATSEFMRWHDGPLVPAQVSSELREMLEASDRWRSRSEGAFDPRVEVFSRLWARSAKSRREPSETELREAAAFLSGPAWRVGPGPQSVARLSHCPVSLNAIAKGFIVERACQAGLRPSQGVRGIMLNLGGDLRAQGTLSLKLGIAAPWADSESSDPIALIEVKDRAVATSGASQRGFQIQDRWYSHVIDPRSGRPARQVLSATVIAPSSADADALATVANILEPAATLRIVSGLPEAECLIVTADGRLIQSPGWSRYEAREAAAAPALLAQAKADVKESKKAAEESGPAWSREFEMVVNLEINSPEGEGRRYRRPYIVVWIEDKEGNPVRTISLWVSMGGAGPFQWIPDLKRWYRTDQNGKKGDKQGMVFTIARPTRPPGKYRVTWDGKDDKGKFVPPGEYTVFIDAAREHGTYQNLRKEVTIGGEPFNLKLEGGVEIKSASIEYRKKRAPVRQTQR